MQINTFTYNWNKNINKLFANGISTPNILNIWPKLKYIDPNAIYYFTIQNDPAIIQRAILKLFSNKYHIIINRPNNAVLSARQIILIPTIYKITHDIAHSEMVFEKRGPFVRYCALFSTITFIENTNPYTITFVGAYFSRPKLIDNTNYAAQIINYLRILNSQFVILAGDFNFNNYEKNNLPANTREVNHVDVNLRTLDKLFYNPRQKDYLIQNLKNEKNISESAAIYYWQNNLDKNRVESYDVGPNTITSTFILDKDFLDSSRVLITPIKIGTDYKSIITHNKIICYIVAAIIFLLIIMVIFIIKNIKNMKYHHSISHHSISS